MAVKFYIIVHMLPTIIYKQKEMITKTKKIMTRCVKDIVRSALFISVYIASFQFFCCFSRNIRQRTDKWNVIFASFLCSFSVLIEHSRRRTELALYLFPRFLESLFLYLQKKKLVKAIPNGEVLVFATAMGIIMYSMHFEVENINSNYLNIFK